MFQKMKIAWKAEAEPKAKTRKLSVVDEEPGAPRSRLDSNSDVLAPQKRSPIRKPTPGPLSSLARIENSNFLAQPPESFEPPKSPIPLPPGVVNIDDFEDGTKNCGRDVDMYLRHREIEFQGSIIQDIQKVKSKVRNAIVSWIIKLMHSYFHDQVTVYCAINLFDQCMVKLKGIALEHMQLIAIACVLIATKLEEYHAVDISELVDCTDQAYRTKDVLRAERIILSELNFRCFGEEVVSFLDRFIAAAMKEGDKDFRTLCMFFLDSTAIDLYKWNGNLASKRAAAAVYAALHIPVCGKISRAQLYDDNLWTPTLKYYTAYNAEDLALLSCSMLESIVNAVKYMNKDIPDDEFECPMSGPIVKFMSRGRQRGLLRQWFMCEETVSRAFKAIEKRSGLTKENADKNRQ